MMKRRRLLITGVLLLLGGAIVNIAVAWGCAIWSASFAQVWIDGSDVGLPSKGTLPIPSFARRAHDEYCRTQPLYLEGRSGYSSFGFDVYTVRTLENRDRHVQTSSLVVGWPMPSLWARYMYHIDSVDLPEGATPKFIEQRQGILLTGAGNSSAWWIPGLPIWPGFAINTIFYAAILWVVWFTPGMVRRRIRRRRGLCPACAYPIGASPVCAECGAAVKARVLL